MFITTINIDHLIVYFVLFWDVHFHSHVPLFPMVADLHIMKIPQILFASFNNLFVFQNNSDFMKKFF